MQVTGQWELNVSLSVMVFPLAGRVAQDKDPSSVPQQHSGRGHGGAIRLERTKRVTHL